MEYYILENEENYIKETIIDITGMIKHNTTNNVAFNMSYQAIGKWK